MRKLFSSRSFTSLIITTLALSGALSPFVASANEASKVNYSTLQRSSLRQLNKPTVPIVSKSDGKLDVSVDWLYADESRATVQYRVSGVPVADGYHLPCAVQIDAIGVAGLPAVKDFVGLMNHCQRQSDGSYTVLRTVPVSGVKRLQTLPVSLDVTVGGNVFIAKLDSKLADPSPLAESKFHFDLSTLVASGLTVGVMQQTQANGVVFAPKQLRFSKGFADADVCITLPDTGDWMPSPILVIGGKQFEGTWLIPDFREPGVLSTPTRCYVFEFALPSDLEFATAASKIGLRVDRLELGAPEGSASTGPLSVIAGGWTVDVPVTDAPVVQ